jgi:hypothetical protein
MIILSLYFYHILLVKTGDEETPSLIRKRSLLRGMQNLL